MSCHPLVTVTLAGEAAEIPFLSNCLLWLHISRSKTFLSAPTATSSPTPFHLHWVVANTPSMPARPTPTFYSRFHGVGSWSYCCISYFYLLSGAPDTRGKALGDRVSVIPQCMASMQSGVRHTTDAQEVFVVLKGIFPLHPPLPGVFKNWMLCFTTTIKNVNIEQPGTSDSY